MTRLHVLLGSGGVGKTTLAAGYALALARDGHRVGLLGADPSRRVQDALGVTLADLDAAVPGIDGLRAAIVQPHQAITRWVDESVAVDDATRLAANPFFAALGDRLATASDILAAARIAEWLEREPATTDLVVDTAPGLAAIELVRSPRQLAALARGRMIRWFAAAARTGSLRVLGARRVLGALANIGGGRMVVELAEFFALVRAPLERMLARVEVARRWLASADCELLLVTSSRDADASGAASILAALHDEALSPSAVIVNRTWPDAVAAELAAVEVPEVARKLVTHVQAELVAQARVIDAVSSWELPVIAIPSATGELGRDGLADLGANLAEQILRASHHLHSPRKPWRAAKV